MTAAGLVRTLTRGPLNVLLLLAGTAWLTPTLGLLVSSLRTAAANSQSGWWAALGAPGELTLESYRRLLQNPGSLRALLNTALITLPSTFLVVGVGALAAYAFVWMRFRGRDRLFLLVVALLVVPLQVALIPVADLYNRLGLFGTILGAVLFHTAFGLPFAVFLLRNFIREIPPELVEAARLEGAGDLRVFLRVVIPLAVPAIASLVIFQFLWVWNDLLVALVFTSPESAPLTVFVRDQLRQFGSNIDIIAPGALLQMVVPLGVFFVFQRYFVQGILAGSGR
ncbi:MAG TPA: carbohydrate ABC transporter permease [Candidatus Methylomirabilis sp.]|nr:carbohydrate ABC transporter permease [Candidatus Methylomirabilis sp.]